jgi:hypothetical protein
VAHELLSDPEVDRKHQRLILMQISTDLRFRIEARLSAAWRQQSSYALLMLRSGAVLVDATGVHRMAHARGAAMPSHRFCAPADGTADRCRGIAEQGMAAWDP